MTFVKRHWPDLIITSLILALLAGFASILLGADKKATEPTTSASPPAQTTVTRPNQPDTPQARDANASPPTQTATVPPATKPKESDADEDDLPTIPSETIGLQRTPGRATSLETSGQAQTAKTPEANQPGTTQNPQRQPEVAQPAASTANVTPGTPVPTSRNGTPTRAEYRLSAGVFKDEASARQYTDSITRRGYRVHVIPIPEGVVAQVGPFADRDTASKAASDIRGVYNGIVLYSPVGQPAEAPSTPNGEASSTPAQPETPEQKPTTPTRAAPAPQSVQVAEVAAAPQASQSASTPVYLQVGAFDRQESAATLVQRLRAEGLNAEVNAPPGKKVRVLIGPLSGDTITRTESKLKTLNIDHFRIH